MYATLDSLHPNHIGISFGETTPMWFNAEEASHREVLQELANKHGYMSSSSLDFPHEDGWSLGIGPHEVLAGDTDRVSVRFFGWADGKLTIGPFRKVQMTYDVLRGDGAIIARKLLSDRWDVPPEFNGGLSKAFSDFEVHATD